MGYRLHGTCQSKVRTSKKDLRQLVMKFKELPDERFVCCLECGSTIFLKDLVEIEDGYVSIKCEAWVCESCGDFVMDHKQMDKCLQLYRKSREKRY
jgi:hypothetical protein